MKRFWFLLRSVLGFVPLAITVILSLRVQALWLTGYEFEMFLPVVLWLVLITSWAVRYQRHRVNQAWPKRRAWVLPVCFAFVAVCAVTHLPLRVLFWTQKAALQAAQKQLPFKPGQDQDVLFDGLRPFQVAVSQSDTRFLLWHNKTFSDNMAGGFAFCPGDAGCRTAQFKGYWRYNDGAPFYVPAPPIEYYWDYANGSADYVWLGGDWYATRVRAEDVGDAGD